MEIIYSVSVEERSNPSLVDYGLTVFKRRWEYYPSINHRNPKKKKTKLWHLMLDKEKEEESLDRRKIQVKDQL